MVDYIKLEFITIRKNTIFLNINFNLKIKDWFTIHDLLPVQSVKHGGTGTSFLFLFLMLLSLLVSILTGGSVELMWSLANTLQIMFYYNSLDLNFTPELKDVFTYMKYSNFDNKVFEYKID